MNAAFRSSPYVNFSASRILNDEVEFFESHPQPWSVDSKIDYFQLNVEIYQLLVAVEMAKQIESAEPKTAWHRGENALASVLASYFEMIGKIIHPASNQWKTSSIDFNYGFCDVYPKFADATNNRYDDETLEHVAKFRDLMRNGLYHLGAPKKNLIIHTSTELGGDFHHDIVTDKIEDTLAIGMVYFMNPVLAARTIANHFGGFIGRLKKTRNSSLRQKFEKFYDNFFVAE